MPVTIHKTPQGCYRVSTPGGVKAKCTTKRKAAAQARLLHGIDQGWHPTGAPANREDLINQQALQLIAEVLRRTRYPGSHFGNWGYCPSCRQTVYRYDNPVKCPKC